jgi:hypothetical protein
MTSTFTPNKSLELPGFNDYVNSWNTPVNADFTVIDTALGGVTNLNATAVSGNVTLTSAQYRPIQIVVSGTLTANVRYLIPSSVGGQWTITNSTTGAFTLSVASAAGGSNITLPSGTTIVSCDGTATGMRLSLTSTAVTSFSAGATGLTPSTATQGAVTLAGNLAVANGGTGLTATPANGQVDIGNGTGFTRATLTAGSGVTITNGAGSITISSAVSGGTVTSVNVSGGSTGLTTSGGPVTGSGTITLAGTLGVGFGGTGITTTPTNGKIPIGNGTNYTAATLTAGTGISITNGAGSVTLAASVAGALKNVQVFTSSGTYTRGSGVTTAVVIAVGGGGGGKGANGGSAGGNGGNGGTTSFGAHVTAAGGTGSTGSQGGAGGTGGTSATLAIPGQGGGTGLGAASAYFGGIGGGQGGGRSSALGTAGTAGSRGGGGSGGSGDTPCGPQFGGGGGGQGETGIKYTTTVGATETVTIGAGGTAGTGPSSPGGAGGAGYIIVYEYS